MNLALVVALPVVVFTMIHLGIRMAEGFRDWWKS